MSDYEYMSGYHKGAFQALLNLKNVIEHFQHGSFSKMIPKKVYRLLLTYIDCALHNVDEFMDYGGIPHIIIDKDNNCRRISEQEAIEFMTDNQKKAREKKKAAH